MDVIFLIAPNRGALMRCVFCAEEIQDEASLCRFCNRGVLTSARSLAYQSGSYALGRTTDDGYAIWNASAGGPPVERFSSGDEGWRAAWGRWQQYTGPPPATPAVASAQYVAAPTQYVAAPNNGKAIASLVLGLLWLYGIGSVLALIFGYIGKNEIEASGNVQQGRGMAIAGIVLGWVGVGGILLLIAIGVLAAASGSYSGY